MKKIKVEVVDPVVTGTMTLDQLEALIDEIESDMFDGGSFTGPGEIFTVEDGRITQAHVKRVYDSTYRI